MLTSVYKCIAIISDYSLIFPPVRLRNLNCESEKRALKKCFAFVFFTNGNLVYYFIMVARIYFSSSNFSSSKRGDM